MVLNAAPAQPLPQEFLALIDVLIVNAGELAIVANSFDSIAQCLALIEVPCVIVTLGKHGCCARSDGVFLFQPAFDVTPIDSTGAGDTFCGVLIAALSKQEGLPQALQIASAAASLACTRLGAQQSIPTHEEVEEFLRSVKTHTDPEHAALLQYCGTCE